MYARRVVPFLLIAGGVMMIMHHKREEFMGQCEEREQQAAIGPHHGPRGEWGKHIPPLFDMWHKRAHEQESQSAAI